MNNAVYGKNLRNRTDEGIVSNQKYYLKQTLKPSYKSQKIFDNDLVLIHKSKVRLTPKKPAYVGMCVSDLSKVLMHQLRHDYIKNKYGNSSILFH